MYTCYLGPTAKWGAPIRIVLVTVLQGVCCLVDGMSKPVNAGQIRMKMPGQIRVWKEPDLRLSNVARKSKTTIAAESMLAGHISGKRRQFPKSSSVLFKTALELTQLGGSHFAQTL